MRSGHFESSDAVLTPAELEFYAEEELITIVPKITVTGKDEVGRDGHLALLSGTYGKFEPNKPVDVPIWLAIELRRRNACDIKLPPWMTLKELKEVVQKEKTDMSSFQPLPFHYIEVAKLLLTHAKEDIGQNYLKTRDMLTSIQCLRMNKIVQGIQQVQGPVTITLRNLSAFECNQVRHLFLGGMDHFHELSDMVMAAETSSDQRTQTTGTGTATAPL